MDDEIIQLSVKKSDYEKVTNLLNLPKDDYSSSIFVERVIDEPRVPKCAETGLIDELQKAIEIIKSLTIRLQQQNDEIARLLREKERLEMDGNLDLLRIAELQARISDL